MSIVVHIQSINTSRKPRDLPRRKTHSSLINLTDSGMDLKTSGLLISSSNKKDKFISIDLIAYSFILSMTLPESSLSKKKTRYRLIKALMNKRGIFIRLDILTSSEMATSKISLTDFMGKTL